MRENLGGVVVRLGVFLAVCLLTAFLLIAVFGEVRFGDGKTYYAEFANVSNLRTGKLVRIAGVEVGKVTRISINPDATVRVQFTADNSVTLTRGTRAVIRYDNLFGDRYLALEEGAGGLAVLRPGHTIPLARTQPALDLDALIGGFKPLFRALNPEQVNALSEQLLHAFAGQGPTIGSLLAQSAAVTNTLADRDRLIGQVITNLNVVLGSLGAHTDRLDQAVTSLSALIHRLAQRKTDISNAVAYTNAAAGSVADLLSQARAPLAKVVRETESGGRHRGRRPRLPRQSAQHAAGQIPGAGPPGYVRRLLRLLPVRRRAQGQRQGRPAGVHQAGRSGQRAVRAEMKSFAERNRLAIGTVGIVVVAAVALAALQYQRLPFFNQGTRVSAYFADAGGLRTGNTVEVSGYPVGKVSSISLDGPGVLVEFKVDTDVRLGNRTEVAIKTKGLLGSKFLDVTPRGDGRLDSPIPIERTTSPYQLPDALGDLAATISGLHTERLSESLATLAQTFADTPAHFRNAIHGVARLAQTLDERDNQLRSLLANAAKATGVLANRTDQIVGLVRDTNVVLAQLRTQSAALDRIWANISAVAEQLRGFIAENRQQLRPALDKLNGVLAIVENRKERVRQAIPLINTYVMSLGESLSSGPFFKAYVVNLLPGQFVQPFISAAFSDLGLDPATLLPSQLTDPPTGQPGTPPLPMPYPRTGQGGEPRLTLPDAITGNPGDPRYPYRPEPPAPPPGGPPPGPPAQQPGDQP